MDKLLWSIPQQLHFHNEQAQKYWFSVGRVGEISATVPQLHPTGSCRLFYRAEIFLAMSYHVLELETTLSGQMTVLHSSRDTKVLFLSRKENNLHGMSANRKSPYRFVVLGMLFLRWGKMTMKMTGAFVSAPVGPRPSGAVLSEWAWK